MATTPTGGHGSSGPPTVTFDSVIDALAARGCTPKGRAPQARSKCPAHGGANPGSLSITEEDGEILLWCHSQKCEYEAILRALDLWRERVKPVVLPVQTREWDYIGADEKVAYTIVRQDMSDGSKEVFTRYPGPGKGRMPNPRPLYQWQRVEADKAAPVYVVEGEKCVGALWGAGRLAVTNSNGAGAWSKANWAPLAGRNVILLADADEAGRGMMEGLGVHLVDRIGVKSIKALLPANEQFGRTGYDVADAIDQGKLEEYLGGVADWQRPKILRLVEGAGIGRRGVFARKNSVTLEKALGILGMDFRKNVRGLRYEFKLPKAGWVEANDEVRAMVFETVACDFGLKWKNGQVVDFKFGETDQKSALAAWAYRHAVDPFLDWIRALPKWDGVERMATLLTRTVGAADTRLNRWASRYLLCAPVQRAMDPGHKFDVMPILWSRMQGVGKSTVISLLHVQTRREDWFKEGLTVDATEKQFVEKVQGAVHVEMTEMTNLDRVNVQRLNALLSAVKDFTRLSYRKDPETFKRLCIIVGTSNREDCVPYDPSGSRRFVPVECQRVMLLPELVRTMDTEREQLWAEARAWVEAGNDIALIGQLEVEAQVLGRRHQSENEMLTIGIMRMFARSQMVQDISTDQIAEAVLTEKQYIHEYTRNTSIQKAIAAVLRVVAPCWRKRRKMINGVRGRYWSGPETCDLPTCQVHE